MPAELAKALLEDGDKETKESFENVPSLVIATKEDEDGNVDASIPLSDQPNGLMERVISNPPIENGIANPSINPSINPSTTSTNDATNNPSNDATNNPSNDATNNPSNDITNNPSPPSSPPSPLSDNSDLFF